MKFMQHIKMFLWSLNGSEKCPLCRKKLMRHGFEYVNERYTCENKKCDFNKINGEMLIR